jgi:hypothetical protein
MDDFSGTFMGEKSIRTLTENISITPKQQSKASEWLDMMEKGELKGETKQYINFANIILNDILGYDSKKIIHNEDNVEYQYADASGEKILCIEAKGTGTKTLFDPQSRTNNAHRTPISQTWDYMRTGDLEWGICTNYRYFALLKRNEKGKGYLFDFKDIKTEPEKLKEFIGIFSKKHLIDEGNVDNIIYETIIEQKEVGKEFYKLYHETRLMLIQSFTNEDISNERAIYFTQIFLNRLIFIFFVQDKKGFLSNKHLFAERIQNLLNSDQITEHSRKVYDEISELFIAFDKGSPKLGIPRFNGGLFSSSEFPQKIFFSDLKDPNYFKEIIDAGIVTKPIKLNKVAQKTINKYENQLNPIIVNLLLLDSFDFQKEINEEVLGQIFEQSISDLDELKSNGISKRKTDGIFYTPSYITKFICMNTIIPYLSKTNVTTIDELINEYRDDIDVLFEKFKQIKILDPACGSGAFLIQSIDILLDIHKHIQYEKELSGNYSTEGQSLLTKWNEQTEIKTIIENNIHGVDVNRESIEITQLSLFLKLASSERPLSGLSKNIQTGNSLLEDDSGFTWERNFPTIFNDPLLKKNEERLKLTEKLVDGFDIIIGNPPYGADLTKKEQDFLNQKFGISSTDTAQLFMKLSYDLLKPGGYHGFIVPKALIYASNWDGIRKYLIDDLHLLIDVGKVWKEVKLEQSVYVLKKGLSSSTYLNGQRIKEHLHTIYEIDKKHYDKFGFFLSMVSKKELDLGVKLLENSHRLKKYINNQRGDNNNSLAVESKGITTLGGNEIQRYHLDGIKGYMKQENVVNNKSYVTKNSILAQRIVAHIGKPPLDHVKITATIPEKDDFIIVDTVNQLKIIDKKISPYFLLGLLNSKIINWYAYRFIYGKAIRTMQFDNPVTDRIPVVIDNQKNVEVKAKKLIQESTALLTSRKEFESLLKSDLKIEKPNKKLRNFHELEFEEFTNLVEKTSKTKLPLDKKTAWVKTFNDYKTSVITIVNSISNLQSEINQIFYDIFNLSQEEIEIIESTTPE